MLMIFDTFPNINNPSFFLPFYRGDQQRVHNLKPIFFPCHRGNTKGFYINIDFLFTFTI